MAKKLNDSSIATLNSTGLAGKLLVLTDADGRIYKVSPSEFLKLTNSNSSSSGGSTTSTTNSSSSGSGTTTSTIVLGAFGDSITAANPGWVSILASLLNVSSSHIINAGIPGTVLQNSGGQANNGRDRYQSALLGKSITNVFILYGINDILLTPSLPALNPGTFKTQLNEIVVGLIAGGIPANKICLGSPPRAHSIHYENDSGVTRQLQDKYRDAAAQVAYDNSCLYADVFDAMAHNGADSLVGPDYLHPATNGHQVIATAFQNAVVQTISPYTTAPTTANSGGTRANPVNIATGKVASAYSANSNFPASNAIDGDENNFYLSAGTGMDEKWLLDLGAAYTLDSLKILPLSGGWEVACSDLQVYAGLTPDLSQETLVGTTPSNNASTNYLIVSANDLEDVRFISIRRDPTKVTYGPYSSLIFKEVKVLGY